jgi:hypothetical protein
MTIKVAIAGAGVYGATTAIRLAERGYCVTLFDPLGILRAASAINQYRVHSGYHYPRSPETIEETQAARKEFIHVYAPAIVRNTQHYYAIPHEHSRTTPLEYESVMRDNGLSLQSCRPHWMNFKFINKCYKVEENIYDPDVLRELIQSRLTSVAVKFERRTFPYELRSEFDFLIYATYGLGPSRRIFNFAKYQLAEKVLIQLPEFLRNIALVIVDGPFTAFDPYGSSGHSLFGSAKLTNHWTTDDPDEPLPHRHKDVLNGADFVPATDTRFEAMRAECSLAVPAASGAQYIGSRFTMRVVEDSPLQDRRILYVQDGLPGEFHIFSGKVVSAVKAAAIVCEKIDAHA